MAADVERWRANGWLEPEPSWNLTEEGLSVAGPMPPRPTETGRPELPGDFAEGLEASIEVVGGALAPEGDDGGEDWGIPNVIDYIEEHLKGYLVLTSEVPKRHEPSAAHFRGFAQGLRYLADALDEHAEEIGR